MLEKTKSRDDADELHATMLDMGRRARKAAAILATATAERKHAALIGMAEAIFSNRQDSNPNISP